MKKNKLKVSVKNWGPKIKRFGKKQYKGKDVPFSLAELLFPK